MFQKLLDLFTPPSPQMIARRDLLNAERDLLAAHAARESAAAMIAANEARVRRLSAYLSALGETGHA